MAAAVEKDTLEAEIARLEAELAGGGGGERSSLGQFLSSAHHHPNNNHASFADSSAGLSYDEITVDTTEFTQLVQQTATTTTSTIRKDHPVNISIGRASGSFRETKQQQDIIVEEDAEDDEAARIQREIDEMEAAVMKQQQQQQQQQPPQHHQQSFRQQQQPPKSQPSMRRGRKKQTTMRDASSSSLVSALSCDNNNGSSFRQPSVPTTIGHDETAAVRRRSTDSTSTTDLADEAARIQREIDEMEAAMVADHDESGAAAPVPATHRPRPQGSMRSQRSNGTSSSSKGGSSGTKKVLQRRVRKKPSSSMSSTSSLGGSVVPDDEELQRQIAEMEAELSAAAGKEESSTTTTTKSVGNRPAFLAQLNHRAADDDEYAIEKVGTRPDHDPPTPLSHRTKKPPSAPSSSDDNDDDDTFVRPPNPFASAGLLSAISNAAQDREQRLADGGPQKVTTVAAPAVDPRAASAPQLSTSMAEMISARATARDNRLAKGGEKRMTALKPKAEIKKTFSEVVAEAASMGRLTRLDEHVVVAIAMEKTPEQAWKSKGLLAIQWRSNHMAVIHEAARVGNEVKMPEKVVTNAVGAESDDDMMDAYGAKPISERKRQLIEASSTIGEGQAKVDKLILYRKEEQPKEHLLIKPMEAYSCIEEIVLPRKAPPRVDPVLNLQKLNKYKRDMLQSGRPMVDISSIAAERAWERRARLDRPGAMPKMVEKCECPFCQSASPYQTFAYRELFKNRHEIAAREEAERVEQLRQQEERRRQRVAKRQLEQQVAEAEAALAAAKAAAEPPPKQKKAEQAPAKTSDPETAVVMPSSSEIATTPCCACTIM